jgi:hypothetical protein
MSRSHFYQLLNTNGYRTVFNNCLSASKDRIALTDPNFLGVLLVMMTDSSKTTTLFAFITAVSYFLAEDRVRFLIQTMFRLRDIKPMSGAYQWPSWRSSCAYWTHSKRDWPRLNRKRIEKMDWTHAVKEDIKIQKLTMKHHYKSAKNLFLRIIVITKSDKILVLERQITWMQRIFFSSE